MLDFGQVANCLLLLAFFEEEIDLRVLTSLYVMNCNKEIVLQLFNETFGV